MTPSDGVSVATKTLLGLILAIPAEQNIRLTYGGLRKQVQAVAEALAASGVNRGDCIGTAMPNGLPNIVTFVDEARPEKMRFIRSCSIVATAGHARSRGGVRFPCSKPTGSCARS